LVKNIYVYILFYRGGALTITIGLLKTVAWILQSSPKWYIKQKYLYDIKTHYIAYKKNICIIETSIIKQSIWE